MRTECFDDLERDGGGIGDGEMEGGHLGKEWNGADVGKGMVRWVDVGGGIGRGG